jgi:hypothetical protein
MPASRSRTERWKDGLYQVFERGGVLELAVEHADSASSSPDVLWRVKLLRVSETELMVERPAAAGRAISLPVGTTLKVVMSIGQNRWMFNSKVVAECPSPAPLHGALRISMPIDVQRCQRREHARVATTSLQLPKVECWPLLDPASVAAAETANRALILELNRTRGAYENARPWVMPEVGPSFSATLLNISGGGLGLMVDRSEARGIGRSPLMWMRVDLRPEIPAPLAMTARIAHTHLDPEQNVRLGIAFDFTFNPAHRDFVVSQIGAFVDRLVRGDRAAA